METAAFIQACADGIQDSTFLVVSPEEWKDILNFQMGELFPEIGYNQTSTFNVSTISQNLQIDLSGVVFQDLEDVRDVYLEDYDGKRTPYDNWVYFKDIKSLDLDPASSKMPDISPLDFEKVIVCWEGFVPEQTALSNILSLTPAHLALLKKICLREAIRRVLLDHTKLDRYRTLVTRANEYVLLATIRDYTTEIELAKRRLVTTHKVRTF